MEKGGDRISLYDAADGSKGVRVCDGRVGITHPREDLEADGRGGK